MVSILTVAEFVQGGLSAGRTYRFFHGGYGAVGVFSMGQGQGGQRSPRTRTDATKGEGASIHELSMENDCSTRPIWNGLVGASAGPGHLEFASRR